MSKKALVVHSGGMDSSICLALAIKEFGAPNILSLSFSYNQRHSSELVQAEKISRHFGVDHTIIPIDCLQKITENALTDHTQKIDSSTTLVVGRNGLMARLAAIYAHHLQASFIYMGVIEVENSGYRDCSREYMDMMECILRLDLDDPSFEIRTPLVKMTKCETLQVAQELGVLEYLLEETVTCYEGLRGRGCEKCPACELRNAGIKEFNHI